MVAALAHALEAPIDADTADCLFLALVTDTGGFRFANATPAAFEAAARLVRDGAEVERVSKWIYESQPEGAIRLLGELLSTLRRRGGQIIVHLRRCSRARASRRLGQSTAASTRASRRSRAAAPPEPTVESVAPAARSTSRGGAASRRWRKTPRAAAAALAAGRRSASAQCARRRGVHGR
jgi:hypothetical protein